MVVQGHRLDLEGQYGPGPGFFPFWVGVGIVVLSLAWFVQAGSKVPVAVPPELVPPRPRIALLVSVVLALVAFMLVLRPLGFNLSMFALLLFLFFRIDRSHPLVKPALALIASFGIHFVFEEFLKMPLPYASVPVLRSLGF